MASDLKSRLQADLNQARKQRDKSRVLVLSTVLADVRYKEIDDGHEADDEAVIQVISRVIHAFRVEVPIRSLFEAPTVANMAVVIVQNLANEVEQEDLDRMLAKSVALSEEQAKHHLTDENAATR